MVINNHVMCVQDGWTALHSAAGNGQLDVVDFLMDINPAIIRQVDNVSKQIMYFLIQLMNYGTCYELWW